MNTTSHTSCIPVRRLLLGASTAIAVLLAAANVAQANPITIFNTGVDANHAVLGDATIGDPHYSLISAPEGSTFNIRVRRASGGFPIETGAYFGDNSYSNWIGPNNDEVLNGPPGLYVYRTIFDLTGLNPATAKLSGQWSSDNEGRDIELNGESTAVAPTSSGAFTSFHPFSITGGFISGINILDFFVVNDGADPTALRVEISGTAAEVPEPATLALVGLSLAALGWSRRKKQ